MNNLQPFNYINQGDGGIANLEAQSTGFRWNNLRADGTPGYEVIDPVAAAAAQATFNPLPWEQSRALLNLRTQALAVMQAGHTTAGGVIVPTDPLSLIIMRSCNDIATANAGATFNLPDATGIFHQLTAVQMISVWGSVNSFMKACLDNWQTLASQINAATDWTTLPMFKFNQGWPT